MVYTVHTSTSKQRYFDTSTQNILEDMEQSGDQVNQVEHGAVLGNKLLNAIRPKTVLPINQTTEPPVDPLSNLHESIENLKSMTISPSKSQYKFGGSGLPPGLSAPPSFNKAAMHHRSAFSDSGYQGRVENFPNIFDCENPSSGIFCNLGRMHAPSFPSHIYQTSPPGLSKMELSCEPWVHPPPGLNHVTFGSAQGVDPTKIQLFDVQTSNTSQHSLPQKIDNNDKTPTFWNIDRTVDLQNSLSTLLDPSMHANISSNPVQVFDKNDKMKMKSSVLLSMLKSKVGESVDGQGLMKTEKFEDAPQCTVNLDGADVPTIIPKKMLHIRATKNQCGKLMIKLRNTRANSDIEMQDGFYLRPGNVMTIFWKLPTDYSLNISMDLVIGLLRYGSQVNTPSIVAKAINVRQCTVIDSYRVGCLQFFAPKSAGQFVFRLYDQCSREASLETLSTSVSFNVVLVDTDIINNLQHVIESFQDDLPIKAINQFGLIVKGIKSCTNNTKDCSNILNRCIERVIEQIYSNLSILDEGSVKRMTVEKMSNPENSCLDNKNSQEEDGKCNEDDEFWKSFRQALRIHAESHDAFIALTERKTPWYLVAEKLKHTIKALECLYCPILKRYFASADDISAHRTKAFEFSPSINHLSGSGYMELLPALNTELRRILPNLVPSVDFALIREKTRARLELDLTSMNLIPVGTRLAIYGSSANNFGSDGADLDMCLIFPVGLIVTQDEKGPIIDKISEVLIKMGMKDVKTRSTARIPIVQFLDTFSGLECDISLHNPLALANTMLLKTYSIIDSRVRELAYVIKHWVKRRHINSPQDGTLSSYGYILTILHFLQVLKTSSLCTTDL